MGQERCALLHDGEIGIQQRLSGELSGACAERSIYNSRDHLGDIRESNTEAGRKIRK